MHVVDNGDAGGSEGRCGRDEKTVANFPKAM
jgi:hypothetical protein